MTNYCVLIRAFNLPNRKRISCNELKSIFERMKFTKVSTYGNTGNVVFYSDESYEIVLNKVQKELDKELGYHLDVYLRTSDEMKKIYDFKPFDDTCFNKDTGKLQVLVLLKPPTEELKQKVSNFSTNDDVLVFGDKELYWLPASGDAMPARWEKHRKSTFNYSLVEKLIGNVTLRTKGLLDRIAKKYFIQK